MAATVKKSAASVYFVDGDSHERERMVQAVRDMNLNPIGFDSAERFLDSGLKEIGVMVCDIQLPGMSGLELQVALRTRKLFIPVVVVTGLSSVRLVVEAMKNGATTVLKKPASDEDLWLAIREAISVYQDESQRQNTMLAMTAEIESLTPQEKEVLGLVVEGIPNKSIAKKLDVSVRTVEARRNRILQKLHVGSLAALIRKVVTLELVHPPHSVVTRPAHLRHRLAPRQNEPRG